MSDPINHPDHYTSGGVEAIDVIEAWGLGFCLGNALKYIARAGRKDPTKRLEDLQKARWYLEREIARTPQILPIVQSQPVLHLINRDMSVLELLSKVGEAQLPELRVTSEKLRDHAEARLLVAARAVRVNGNIVDDPHLVINRAEDYANQLSIGIGGVHILVELHAP